MRDSIVDYLNRALPKSGFRSFGPNSWIFENDVDKMLVYVSRTNVVLVHDGENVFDGFESLQLLDGEDDESLRQLYLQHILHRF